MNNLLDALDYLADIGRRIREARILSQESKSTDQDAAMLDSPDDAAHSVECEEANE